MLISTSEKVTGPASATDNALARFDGTTGKLVQNSGVTVDDNGNMTVNGTAGFGVVPGAGMTIRTAAPSGTDLGKYAFAFDGTFNSSTTSFAVSCLSQPSTAAASFTLPNLTHFRAAQGTVGAGSVVTGQYGFLAASSLTGATNNYGFYSDIPAGPNRWNFYAGGTADNFFAGNVACGSAFTVTGVAGFQGSTALSGVGATFPSTSTAIAIRNAAGNNVAGTSGFRLFKFSDNHLYFDNAEGDVVFRKSGFASLVTFAQNGDALFYGNLSVGGGGTLGYRAGSGGTVTQVTSKSTAVTLNKPSGQITMQNAALAANTTVGFTLNNSTIATGDIVLVTFDGTFAFNYQTWARTGAGSASIYLQNISAGSLSEAVIINFAVIKGSLT